MKSRLLDEFFYGIIIHRYRYSTGKHDDDVCNKHSQLHCRVAGEEAKPSLRHTLVTLVIESLLSESNPLNLSPHDSPSFITCM